MYIDEVTPFSLGVYIVTHVLVRHLQFNCDCCGHHGGCAWHTGIPFDMLTLRVVCHDATELHFIRDLRHACEK